MIHLYLLKAHQDRVPNENISMYLTSFQMILNELYYVYNNESNVYIITQGNSLSFISNEIFSFMYV